MIDEITAALQSKRFIYSDEKMLQDGIAQVFKLAEIVFEREVQLTPQDRIDFMAGEIGVEVKIKGTYQDLLRQLHRYAQLGEIKQLILVTPLMRMRMPPELNNKKVVTITLTNL